MSQEAANTANNITEKISSQLGADKKKTIAAVGLLLVMVFMWFRMLGNKGPEGAEAALPVAAAEETKAESAVSYKKLPEVEGRNDVLTRDFFSAKNLTGFAGEGQKTGRDQDVTAGDGVSKGSMQRLAEKLKLEAIMVGKKPFAFINNNLATVGDEIIVKDGEESYICKVTEIKETCVKVKYKDSEIALKLTQTTATSVK
jgi:hypothetical protein